MHEMLARRFSVGDWVAPQFGGLPGIVVDLCDVPHLIVVARGSVELIVDERDMRPAKADT